MFNWGNYRISIIYNDISVKKLHLINITIDNKTEHVYYYKHVNQRIQLIFFPNFEYVSVNRDNPDIILIPIKEMSKKSAIYTFKWFYERNIFVHEITHLHDFVRNVPSGNYWKDNGEVDTDIYYNTPIENNAFFIEGVAGIIQDKNVRNKLNDFNSFFEYVLKFFNKEYVESQLDFKPKRFKNRLYKIFDLLNEDDSYLIKKNKKSFLNKVKNFFKF